MGIGQVFFLIISEALGLQYCYLALMSHVIIPYEMQFYTIIEGYPAWRGLDVKANDGGRDGKQVSLKRSCDNPPSRWQLLGKPMRKRNCGVRREFHETSDKEFHSRERFSHYFRLRESQT